MLAAWKPVLPLMLIALVFLHCHRVLWLDQSWGLSTQLNSLAVSALVVVALLVRALGQALSFGEVIGVAHPSALSHLQENRGSAGSWRVRYSLACSALLVVGPGLVLGALGVLPGLMVVAFMIPVTGIIALEGCSLSEALLRRLRFPPGVFVRGLVTTAVLTLALLLCWVNLVAGAQLLVVLVRMMSGVDVGVLSVWFSPLNVDFLICTLGLSFLLVEPVWLILRGLLYLDAHLSRSGMDLVQRWQELDGRERDAGLAAPGGASVAGGLLVLLLTLSLFSGSVLAAEPAALEWPHSDAGAPSALEFADFLDLRAAAVEERVQVYEQFGSANLEALRLVLLDGAAVDVQIGEHASIEVDFSVLVDVLPEILHTEDQAHRLQLLSERLRESARFIRTVEGGSADQGSGPEAGLSAAQLLEEELREGGYQLPEAEGDGRLYREGVRARLIRWWTAWLDSMQPKPAPPTRDLELPDISPVVLGFMTLILGVLLLAVFFRSARGRHRRVKSSLEPAAPLPGAKGGMGLQAGDLRGRALELAEQQRYEEATRALFLATLVDLDRCREIDCRPERSNGEYLVDFAGTAERRAVFVQAIRRFEAHCYGQTECARDDFLQMLEITSALTPSNEEIVQDRRRGTGRRE